MTKEDVASRLGSSTVLNKKKYFIAVNGTTEFKPKLSTAAIWDQTNGLTVTDAVFPHITFGFRGQKLPIASYHVSIYPIRTFVPLLSIILWVFFLESAMADFEFQRHR